MFRCNLPDLGSVISGDLEVSVFQKFAIAQSAQTVQFNFKYIFQAFEANPTGNPASDAQEFWVHGPTRALFMNSHKMPLLQIMLYSVDGLS